MFYKVIVSDLSTKNFAMRNFYIFQMVAYKSQETFPHDNKISLNRVIFYPYVN